MAKYYSVSVNTPLDSCDKLRLAWGEIGAGKIGNYHYCSFSYRGIGRSIPKDKAKPAIGIIGQLEEIQEEKIETFCLEDQLIDVIKVIKDVHPYEEPSITYFPIEIV